MITKVAKQAKSSQRLYCEPDQPFASSRIDFRLSKRHSATTCNPTSKSFLNFSRQPVRTITPLFQSSLEPSRAVARLSLRLPVVFIGAAWWALVAHGLVLSLGELLLGLRMFEDSEFGDRVWLACVEQMPNLRSTVLEREQGHPLAAPPLVVWCATWEQEEQHWGCSEAAGSMLQAVHAQERCKGQPRQQEWREQLRSALRSTRPGAQKEVLLVWEH